MTSSRLLARNSALSFVGQALPFVLAIATIPALVRGLGAERFAVLTLAWALIGYFSLFELGLGRALTQAVAQRLGSADEDRHVGAVAWPALGLLFMLGALGGAAIALATPVLVTRVLNVPVELQGETTIAFRLLAVSMPLVVSTAGLRGLMEAHQHFGVATALRIPVAAVMFIGPLLVLPFSRSIVPAVGTLVVGRALGFLMHLIVCLRRYAFLRAGVHLRSAPVAGLLRFGGWTTVSNVVSPLMVFLDRFLIGALMPLAAVAHYVTPFEIVTKLLVIPQSVVIAVFPALAATVMSDRARMMRLYDQSMRGIVVLTFPVVLVATAFAAEGLQLWLQGVVLPPESGEVFKWLALGVFLNGIAQPPLVALQSAARPDLVARLHVIELPIYAIAIFVLVERFGLPGVAMAWTLRVAIDAVALLALSRRLLELPVAPRLGGARAIVAMIVMLILAGVLEGVRLKAAYVSIALSAFVPFAWFSLLTGSERDALKRWIGRPAAPGASTQGSEGAA
jgi:O-antigen/teichoic acid export membrane protein